MIDKRSYILSKFPDVEPNSAGEIHTRCPFHDDRSPSFSISVAPGREGVFVCGSRRCGVRGNFPMFYKMMENITSWREVYDRLKVTRIATNADELFGVRRKNGKHYEISQFPAPPHAQVENIVNLEYLNERGLGPEIIDTFGLLYGRDGFSQNIDVSSAIIAPVYDLDGTYLTFQVRYLLPEARMRWRSPSNSPIQQLLYAGWLVPYWGKQELWIVEGASDVWNLHRQGLQAVGLFTKEASDGQLNRLVKLCGDFNLDPVVCLDGDTYPHPDDHGKGAKKDYGQAIQFELQAYGLDTKLVHLRKHEDPGGLSPERLNQIISEIGG